MKGRTRFLMPLIFAVFLAAGCATASREMQSMSESIRTDIFIAAKEGEPVPEGYGELTIRASIKTHSGEHAVWWIKDIHGKPGYPFLLNIDGQAAMWKAEGHVDDKPKSGDEGGADPEAGSGRKYVLEERIRLREGPHTVFFGLPAEDYFTRAEIEIMAKRQGTLEFKPVYHKYGRTPNRNFLLELEYLEVFMDGEAIH
jgi:hypothetical protein